VEHLERCVAVASKKFDRLIERVLGLEVPPYTHCMNGLCNPQAIGQWFFIFKTTTSSTRVLIDGITEYGVVKSTSTTKCEAIPIVAVQRTAFAARLRGTFAALIRRSKLDVVS
jgi:Asp/Glu/hydantoin racemase